MQLEYERIRSRATQDPGTAGDEGEENWASLFRKWLPGDMNVAVKGRVLCANGAATDQVDVALLPSSYPKGMLGKKMYLASEVVGVFECKTTLKRRHIEEVVERASAAKSTIYAAHGREIIYGLIAHSHAWRSEKEKVIERISDVLASSIQTHVKHPNDVLDIVCVADLASWLTRTLWDPDEFGHGVATVHFHSATDSFDMDPDHIEDPPIGSMVSYLLRRLSFFDQRYEGLANYFGLSSIEYGQSDGRHMRIWRPSRMQGGKRKVRLIL